MLFNSFPFLVFMLLFYLLFWGLGSSQTKQNLILALGSLVFYAWWEWRVFFLLFFVSSAVVYYFAIKMDGSPENKKKHYLNAILFLLLGVLAYFKYSAFFIENVQMALSQLGVSIQLKTLHLVLPLGISFYTFRLVGYMTDVYNEEIEACQDPLVFFNFASFFPSFISGPIEKASDFIPQLEKKRVWNEGQFKDGMRQILLGVFQKMVVGDGLLVYYTDIMSRYQTLPASSLLVAMPLGMVQIYFDFAGYSNMALGIGKLLGFRLAINFSYPFFAQNISDFWKRWHISLTGWLTKYVYTPLSFHFRKYGKTGTLMAIFINLIAVGIWHGANWTYAVYGFVHACFFIPLVLNGSINKQSKIPTTQKWPQFSELKNMLFTFSLVVLASVLFLADSLSEVLHIYSHLLQKSLISLPAFKAMQEFTWLMLLVIIYFILEWKNRKHEHVLVLDDIKHTWLRYLIYQILIVLIAFFGFGNDTQFVYFNF